MVSGSRLRVQGFGFRLSGLGVRESGFGFRVWGVGCGVVGPGFRDPGFGCRFAGFGCWVWHPGLALLALHSKGAPSSRGRCRLAIRARCSGFSFRIPPLSQVQATGHRLVPGFGFRGSGSKWVNALIIAAPTHIPSGDGQVIPRYWAMWVGVPPTDPPARRAGSRLWRCMVQGSGLEVQGAGSTVEGSGFMVSGSRLRVQGFGFRLSGLGVRESGFGFRVWGVGCGVVGPGFRDPGFGCRFAGFGCWVWHPGLALLALHSKGAPSSRGRCRLAIRARCSGFSFRIPPLSQVQATGHRLVPGFGFRGSGSKRVKARRPAPGTRGGLENWGCRVESSLGFEPGAYSCSPPHCPANCPGPHHLRMVKGVGRRTSSP
jgi:hypothetical protein